MMLDDKILIVYNNLVFRGKILCKGRSLLCLDLENKSPDDLDFRENCTGGTDTGK